MGDHCSCVTCFFKDPLNFIMKEDFIFIQISCLEFLIHILSGDEKGGRLIFCYLFWKQVNQFKRTRSIYIMNMFHFSKETKIQYIENLIFIKILFSSFFLE